MNKIALVGYGQMGKLLQKLAPEYNAEVTAIIDPLLNNKISEQYLQNAEVCIEFTNPSAVIENIKKIAQLKKNIVVGTTGWSDKLPEVTAIVRKYEIGLVYGANFSLGMNLFFNLTEHLSRLMNKASEYDAWGVEKHHNKKIDSPSGTAVILSDILLKNLDSKQICQFDRIRRKINPDELHFASIRAGNIPGDHIIGFDSIADSIEIKHSSRNRDGLAIGALKAAQWIRNKKGMYNFNEIFEQILELDGT
ncbi:MAG: 4-hydroxy-tetrahydrodipicolinate reductase [Candidatus Cloacimonas sp. SDB]|nr:MAG: 4-hydroxy-tetrahydrodipicolinate reductase [Candidatus Cloacimonas sp. SDB]